MAPAGVTTICAGHGSPTFLLKWATPIIWAGSRVARGKITVSGIPRRNYCEIFIGYTQVSEYGRGTGIGDP